MSNLFDEPSNPDEFYFDDVEQLRAWLRTFTDAELAVVQRVAYRARYLKVPDWCEGQTDTVYAVADGELDNRMFAKMKAHK